MKIISNRRMVFGALGILLSALGLWFVFRGIDVDELLASSHRIRLLPLIGSVAIYWCVLVVVRSLLVRHLLRPLGPVSLGKVYRYICVGFLANNVLPLRMGEGARVVGIAQSSGLGIVSVAGSLAVERLLDMTMVVLIAIIAAQLVPVPDILRIAALVTGCGVVVAYAILIVAVRRRLTEKPNQTPRRLWVSIWNLGIRFISGFKALGSSRSAVVAIAYGVALWVVLVGSIALRLVAFDLPLNLPMTLVLLAFLGLGVALPSAPAYAGIYQAAAVLALHDVFHIEKEIALGFAFFSWFVDVIFGSTIGAICLFLEGLSLSDLKRSTAKLEKTGA